MSFLLKKDDPNNEVGQKSKDSGRAQENLQMLINYVRVDSEKEVVSSNTHLDKLVNGRMQANDIAKGDKRSIDHDPHLLRVACICPDCLKHREAVIMVFLEDIEYNNLWERLQLLVRNYYDLISKDPESIQDHHYKLMMPKRGTKWLSDGIIDTKKNIQISLGANLPLSNEMTFILIFSMLYTRDPHQLFELLCIQIRSIVLAYNLGLKDILKKDENGVHVYNPTELLNFILNGYESLCNSAKNVSPLLYELQRGHLQKFSLTWSLLNKRIYQRWVYFDVQKLMPECILKLKEEGYTDAYKDLIYRFIKFDDEMTLTNQMWNDVWSLLHDYHMSREELERRMRISKIHSVLTGVRISKIKVIDDDLNTDRSLVEWMNSENRSEVWQLVVHYLQNKYVIPHEERILAGNPHFSCQRCTKYVLGTHFIDCRCRTCNMGGSICYVKVNKNTYCPKCSLFKLDRDYFAHVSKIVNKRLIECNEMTKRGQELIFADTYELERWRNVLENNDMKMFTDKSHFDRFMAIGRNRCYHLSWVLFKHLPDRVPYKQFLSNAMDFCIFQNPPCNRTECRVASHVITGIYPLTYSLFLMKCYQPLNDIERNNCKVKNTLEFAHLLKDFVNQMIPLHCMDMLWVCDEIDPTLVRETASTLAECYLSEFIFPNDESIYPCFLSLLKATGSDVELDMEQLEAIYNARSTMFKLHHESPKINNDISRVVEMKKQLIKQSNVPPKIQAPATKSLKATITATDGAGTSNSAQREVIQCFDVSGIETEETDINKEHLNEAIKFVVNKKINKKLEAELRSLKKEHSVLKDMVRDLEQIKEYEEKQIQSRSSSSSGSGNGSSSNGNSANNSSNHTHQCCSENMDQGEGCKENHSSKMCHRSNGQCACYYCTIFGHTECNHGRNNETRDRLRKRLHQIHSNKKSNKTIDFMNMKNTPEVFKNIVKSSYVTNSNKEISGEAGTSGLPKKTSNIPVPPKKREVPVVLKPKTPPLPPTINLQDNKKTVRKIRTTIMKEAEVATPCPPPPPPSIPIPVVVPPQPVIVPPIKQKVVEPPASTTSSETSSTRSPIDCWRMNDLLKYIEGPASGSMKAPAKKAAKKAKQKQKKEEQRHIEMLNEVYIEFQEACQVEFESRKHIKTLKSAKKKDKKEIAEHHEFHKVLDAEKQNLEKSMKGLISTIKQLNPDFKFSYQVAKEPEVKKPTATQEKTVPLHPQYNNNVKVPNIPVIQSLVNQSMNPGQNCEISLDPAKRMVTIRRVNVPHSEPQVTVTAKGASPDKDQLLYTFINGQLVPAGTVREREQKIVKNLQPKQLFLHQQQQQIVVEPKIGKKDKKKEQTVVEPVQSKKNKKKSNKVEEIIEEPIVVEPTTIPATKNSKKKKNKEVVPPPASSTPPPVVEEVLTKKSKKEIKKAKRAAAASSTPEPIVNPTPTPPPIVKEEPPAPVKPRIPTPRLVYDYIDPQYKKNKFELLDMDEDYYEPEPEIVEPSPEKVEVKPKKTEKSGKTNERVGKNKKEVQPKIVQPTPVQPQKTVKVKQAEVPAQIKKPVEPPPPVKLSKKQRKKLNKAAEQPTVIDKTVKKAEKLAKSLTQSMQRLNLNTDTTIELVNEAGVQIDPANNFSIMDQLNRGVRVEGLTLPPGITLTRVDPTTAEAVKAKKEAIQRLSKPMQPQQNLEQAPQQFSMMGHNSMMGLGGQDPGGVIMVDTLNMAKKNQEEAKKVSKKNKKKNKNKNADADGKQNKKEPQNPKMVTLRNPMFHQGAPDPNAQRNASFPAVRPPTQQQQQQQRQVVMDQPAAIIKNENGMFTIRNPVLHHAMQSTGGPPSNYPPFNPQVYGPPGEPSHHQQQQQQQQQQQNKHNFSYFSDGSSNNSNTNGVPPAAKKIHSAIGSEIKNAQLQKQQTKHWQPTLPQPQQPLPNGNDVFNPFFNPPAQSRSYSPFEPSQHTGFGFNSDFIGSSPTLQQQQHQSQQSSSQFYNNMPTQQSNGCFNVFGGGNNSASDSESLFSNNMRSGVGGEAHSSSSSTPSMNHQQYFDNSASGTKYDDLAFLRNLQPGQRLNSEVTIHNISESKFLRNQQNAQNIPNGVEITKIPGPNSSGLAVGSNRNTNSSLHSQKGNEMIGEYGESIFAPNQTVNLNELESEERDIESFKRFNYYFEPPKNKPKVNLNLKDIVVNNKKLPMSDAQYFGEAPIDEQLYNDMSSLNLNTDNDMVSGGGGGGGGALKHAGVIGSEMKILHGHIG